MVHPGEIGLQYRELDIICKDGVKLHGWFAYKGKPMLNPTIVYFHENAGSISVN